MPKLSDLLSALGLAPKTLPQAKETIDGAKATLDSVAALFTAAGLNLEQMLAAGPESLKAHLASLDNTAEVTRLTSELSAMTVQHKAMKASFEIEQARTSGFAEVFASVGIADAAKLDKKEFKTAFDTHVAKQTTLALAKTGHPPAHVPAATETTTPAKTDAELVAEYQAMTPGNARIAFFAKHEAALRRAEAAANA